MGVLCADGRRRRQISHMHVASVERLALTPAGSPLLVRCKNFHSATFVIQRESDCHDTFMSLVALSQPGTPSGIYRISPCRHQVQSLTYLSVTKLVMKLTQRGMNYGRADLCEAQSLTALRLSAAAADAIWCVYLS